MSGPTHVIIPLRPDIDAPVVGVMVTQEMADWLEIATTPEKVERVGAFGLEIGVSRWMPRDWMALRHADGSLTLVGPHTPPDSETEGGAQG